MGSLTWLGHAAFMLGSDRGKRIYVDPFLSDNPKTPDDEKEPDRVDVICVTHGHGDHVGDAVELSQRFPDAEVIALLELKSWLGSKGANVGDHFSAADRQVVDCRRHCEDGGRGRLRSHRQPSP